MAQRALLSSGLSGVAGEYFVAAELSRRGFIATVTPKNTKGVDILASLESNLNAPPVQIQVKTNQGEAGKWILTHKAEYLESPSLFYVLVGMNGTELSPDYHVVPSSVVARACRESHKAWLDTPGRGGRPHKDNPIRQFHDLEGCYKDRWDLLSGFGGAED